MHQYLYMYPIIKMIPKCVSASMIKYQHTFVSVLVNILLRTPIGLVYISRNNRGLELKTVIKCMDTK